MRISYFRILSLVSLHLLIFSLSATLASAYIYSGYKWSGTSASYRINSAFAASFITAMKSADATWDAAGSKFRLNYSGTTSRNPNIYSSSYTADGYSDIGYSNAGSTFTLALTWGASSGTIMSERDTTFNTYYNFTTTGAAGKYDVQDVMTHEFGHWLNLIDLSSSGYPSFCGFSMEDTLCDSIGPEETRKRSLSTDDKNGIISIYGT